MQGSLLHIINISISGKCKIQSPSKKNRLLKAVVKEFVQGYLKQQENQAKPVDKQVLLHNGIKILEVFRMLFENF